MKEKELINIIENVLNSEYIGDDCAYLKDLNIVVTQDSLVEDVHFSLKYTNAYQLGWKSVMVNISDICASGAEPKYLTIALSIPDYVDENFVEEFYKGAKEACGDVKIVGGDITGADKLYISATAIGSTAYRKISSRKNAKAGYKVIVSGEHGNSAKGLEILSGKFKAESGKLLKEGKKIGRLEDRLFNDNSLPSCLPTLQSPDTNHSTDNDLFAYSPTRLFASNKFLQAHLMPVARLDFSKQIATNCKEDYAMMDTSDGLADALMQIAQASSVKIKVDSSKIPHDVSVDMETVLFGGEDYELIAVVPKDLIVDGSTEIGEVVEGATGIEIDGEFYTDIESKLFNHFEKGKDK